MAARRRAAGAIRTGPAPVAPSNAYPCADGSQILIAANRDTVFARLCQVMDQPGLAEDARYATHQARGEHQQELDTLISAWTRRRAPDELLTLLHDAGVPAGRIYRAGDMFADPHFIARQAIVRAIHPELGEFPMQNVVPRLSATPGAVRTTGPALGEHNDAVYRDLLGLTEAEIRQLREGGVI